MIKVVEIHENLLPATRALEKMEGRLPDREYRYENCVSPTCVSACSSLSSIADLNLPRKSFDMNALLRATEPVETSVSFPVIEWGRDDADEDETDSIQSKNKRLSPDSTDDDEEEDVVRRKRFRRSNRGMVRTKTYKSSLCHIGRSSSSTEQTPALAADNNTPSCSWGQFVSEEDSFSIGSSYKLDSAKGGRRRKPLKNSSQLQALAHNPIPLQLANCGSRIL